jgi:nicotinate phosphoribosyltransferase
MNISDKALGLFLDHYELTMAEGYLLAGRANMTASFDYFFRRNPFGSGFVIFAGLQDLLEMLGNFRYNTDALDYLHRRGFGSDFLEYLKNFRFSGKIYAPQEGEIVFPNEPVVSVEGSLIETQMIETLLLNTLNFQSLIATKANRMRHAAGSRTIMEFGMRRAQGSAAIPATRAAVIGGADSTSNVLSAFRYGLASSGTMAHSWIQSFDDELTAFRTYATTHPDNCTLLVDTYDTLKSGVPNAIIVANEMKHNGQHLMAIRLDSGDLAYLAKQSRHLLDQAGLTDVKIVASNQLDEYLIKSLIDQQAPIDWFGVGTSLVTGQKDAALDGVYKLSSINGRPAIKLSEDFNKITLPGKKKIIRYISHDNTFYADAIALADEDEKDIQTIFHPRYPDRNTTVAGLNKEIITHKVVENGQTIIKEKSISEISEYRQHRVSQLPDEHKRFENPHVYKVGLSNNLMSLRNQLISAHRG